MTETDIRALLARMDGRPELIETHISFVILAGDVVYKIKKPLQFSFLDFSSLGQRRQYCEREVQLNRRLAPEMYLEVVPICCGLGDEWGLEMTEEAEVVDYAVKMQRMDMNLEMDRMLAEGRIDLDYMRLLARKIATFHLGAVLIDNPAQSNADAYRSDFNDILKQTDVFVEVLGPTAKARLQAIVQTSDDYLAAHTGLIQRRLRLGYIRDVHGDLHTRNVFAYPDPVIFDCIEFNDHFRQIDVLNEVAFFCMDLEANGFAEHAAVFLEEYAAVFDAQSGIRDKGGHTVVPLTVGKEPSSGEYVSKVMLFDWFKCYRANVRAKVNALRAAQDHGEGPKAEMERYLLLMERYAAVLRTGGTE